MRNFISESKFDFIGQRRTAMFLSSALVGLALLAILIRGLNFGVDFTGGFTIEVGYTVRVEPHLAKRYSKR